MVKKQGSAIPEGFSPVGKNVALKVEDNLLHIVIDLNGNQGPSATGKSIGIATTSGNLPIPGAKNGAVLGLNVYRKP